VRDRLVAISGVVRVHVLGPEFYRVDCDRDLRPEIARGLAPAFELLGIRFAEPSLAEVYSRYFDEVRHAA
jgi:ABC-2 type transport system ATP-binding protein